MRRDAADPAPEVHELQRALEGSETVFRTGFVFPELLQNFHGLRARDRTIDALRAALCARHDLTLPTADRDFADVAALAPLRAWRP